MSVRLRSLANRLARKAEKISSTRRMLQRYEPVADEVRAFLFDGVMSKAYGAWLARFPRAQFTVAQLRQLVFGLRAAEEAAQEGQQEAGHTECPMEAVTPTAEALQSSEEGVVPPWWAIEIGEGE